MKLLGRRALGQTIAVVGSYIPFCRTGSAAMMATATKHKVIDSHLHVWADTQEASHGFPYIQDPPDSLKDEGSYHALLQQMEKSGVDGALIVQPAVHKMDHSYVEKALAVHPDKFKGMFLHDPTLPEEKALQKLSEFAAKGFVGVRFNPYLWPSLGEKKWFLMSEGAGLAVFKRCGELRMPVGIMCFQGLSLHYDDIVQLAEKCPETTLILDHFGFTAIDDQASFEQLLSLQKFAQVYVKVSALFRLKDTSPFQRVYSEHFLPLLQSYGANRLLYGSC